MTILVMSPDKSKNRTFEVPPDCVSLIVESWDRVICNVLDPEATNGNTMSPWLELRQGQLPF